MKQQGTVVRFIAERGFGFLRVDGATSDLFWHEQAVTSDEFPGPGDRVTFELQSDGRRSRAVNVRRIVSGQS
jgi:cold shock CspA family protein